MRYAHFAEMCEKRSRQTTTPAPHHSVFTRWMPFLLPNQQCQSTEGTGTVFYITEQREKAISESCSISTVSHLVSKYMIAWTEPEMAKNRALPVIRLQATAIIQMTHGSECDIQIWWTAVENVTARMRHSQPRFVVFEHRTNDRASPVLSYDQPLA